MLNPLKRKLLSNLPCTCVFIKIENRLFFKVEKVNCAVCGLIFLINLGLKRRIIINQYSGILGHASLVLLFIEVKFYVIDSEIRIVEKGQKLLLILVVCPIGVSSWYQSQNNNEM